MRKKKRVERNGAAGVVSRRTLVKMGVGSLASCHLADVSAWAGASYCDWN